LSLVAEFARQLHEVSPKARPRSLTPRHYPASHDKLYDVKAVVFDVYGTLVDYWKTGFDDSGSKMAELLSAFEHTVQRFRMGEALERIDGNKPPHQTLRDFYHGLIGLSHEKSLKKGLAFPEVRIEQVWEIIILMLKRHGYGPSSLQLGSIKEVAQCAAFYYNFHALGRGLYPGVVEALKALRKSNLKLGIVSNAQFYTPIDLTLFVREQSRDTLDDYLELFDPDLTFFSYEYGVAKPNGLLFRKLYDALYELHILPAQTVYVGNDLSTDIGPAAEAGMLTAFFVGDDKTAFVRDLDGTATPDISFSYWDDLPAKLSFYEKKES
jgi:putative hydrolase of the HAD superfamily